MTGLALAIVLTHSAKADDVAASFVVHPGQELNMIISFKEGGDVPKPILCRFISQGPQREDQKRMSRILDLNRVTKISDREYEVSGTVSDEVASGEYSTQYIVGNINGLARQYEAGADFPTLTIRIENPRQIRFSEIKNVTLKPAAEAGGGGKHQ